MKLDPGADIPAAKLTGYLLATRARNDKSGFFALAGYTQSNWEQLEADLRDQVLPLDGELSRRSAYGDLYTIRAGPCGPNGMVLRIVSV